MTGIKLRTCLQAALAAVASLVIAGAVPHALAQQAGAPAVPVPKGGPAKAGQDKSPWKGLTRAQQVALEPLAGEWDKMEAVRRQKWLEIANRYSSMNPDEQQRVHERMREWVKLTPQQRRLVRENYTRTQKIDPSHKSAQWEQYQQLPEEQKKKLAADAARKKRITSLPKAKAGVAPELPCPAGTIKNPAPAAPACVPAPATLPAAPAPVPPTPAPLIPAPAPNAK